MFLSVSNGRYINYYSIVALQMRFTCLKSTSSHSLADCLFFHYFSLPTTRLEFGQGQRTYLHIFRFIVSQLLIFPATFLSFFVVTTQSSSLIMEDQRDKEEDKRHPHDQNNIWKDIWVSVLTGLLNWVLLSVILGVFRFLGFLK